MEDLFINNTLVTTKLVQRLNLMRQPLDPEAYQFKREVHGIVSIDELLRIVFPLEATLDLHAVAGSFVTAGGPSKTYRWRLLAIARNASTDTSRIALRAVYTPGPTTYMWYFDLAGTAATVTYFPRPIILDGNQENWQWEIGMLTTGNAADTAIVLRALMEQERIG